MSAAAATAQYRRCLDEAYRATAVDRAIDRDILSTRVDDWERAGTLQLNLGTMRAYEAAHARSTVGRCMRAKGYRWVRRPIG